MLFCFERIRISVLLQSLVDVDFWISLAKWVAFLSDTHLSIKKQF